MDFLVNHFGYIVLILATGVGIGWASYPFYQRVIKPLFNRTAK